MRILIFLLSLALLVACGKDQPEEQSTQPAAAEDGAAEADSATPTAEPEPDPAAQAAEIYADYFEESLRLNPLRATFIGDHRFNDQLPNFLGAEHREKQRQLQQKYLDRIQQIDATRLAGQDRLSFDIFVRDRKEALAGFEFPGHLMPLNQFRNLANFFAQLGSGSSAQPFNTVKDYEDWLSRVDGFVTVGDQAIANMKQGVEQNLTQPRVLMEKVIPQLEAHIVDDVEESIFYRPIRNMPESFTEEERLRLGTAYRDAIENRIIPAYRRLRDYIRDEYLAAARETHGMWDLPNGDAWYAYNVRTITTTDMTPDEIHRIGLQEVARIHEEMREVMDEVGFEGDLKDFFEYTKSDKQFYFETEEDLLQAYKDFRSTVDSLVPALFETVPAADYEIRPVEPFRAQSASGASYQRAAPDGSRPGIFYVNTYDLSARPRWAVESLFLHEAAPGHHFQISIQQELEELPRFRRFGGTTAFVEGWGLYAESLGRELGVYQDPYQYYGALAAELWRAIRLVVDTGLHARQWTREEVLEYMYDNAPVAEARAVSEAERFMAIPGQALAYKIGQLKIRELRNRAEAALGDDFDVRAFHTAVLEDGALPLDVLEAKIERWIGEQGST